VGTAGSALVSGLPNVLKGFIVGGVREERGMSSGKTYVVSGGGGFVGRALALWLVRSGHRVVTLARSAYPELVTHGILHHQVDLSTPPEVWGHLCRGADGFFHVAAKVDMWGRREDFFAANVTATRNVLAVCRREGIRKLVFTSSPSVVADGTDLCGIDESYPYPAHHEAYYPETKAIAEREVLAATDLWTVALRPHLIWGPGDTNLLPTIVERARAGRLVQIGTGSNRVDITYIDDCVSAHLCALEALEHTPACRGRAYFISQGEPVELWRWINEVLAANGLPPVTRRVSRRVATGIASVAEFLARLRGGEKEPLLTRFLVAEMATSHYFDISAARRLLGYTPRFSVAAGMAETFGVPAAAYAVEGDALKSAERGSLGVDFL
jgi:nucleoside-diphosphate-sugar epimerase